MKKTSPKCKHFKRFNSNDELLCVNFLTNCKHCFIEEYVKLGEHRNFQLYFVRLIGKPFWARCRAHKRLTRRRNVFSGNKNCSTFGLGCKHVNRLIHDTPNTFLNFPKYDGSSDRGYKTQLKKKFSALLQHKKKLHNCLVNAKCKDCQERFCKKTKFRKENFTV